MAEAAGHVVSVEQLRFGYGDAGFLLSLSELTVRAGAAVALIGPSGSGKTTLLNLIAGVLVPDSGSIRVGDVVVSGLDDAARRAFRRHELGLVFQELELLEYLSVRDNLALQTVLTMGPRALGHVAPRLEALAKTCGIDGLLLRRPRALSQGERQRAALCRALLCEPPLVLADEPTGNLDPVHARTVIELLLADARARGSTLMVVTHDHGLLPGFDHVIDLAKVCA